MDFILKRAEVKDAELLAEMRLEMRKERETASCPMSDEEFYQYLLAFFREHLADGSFISYIVYDGTQAAACSGLSIQVHPPTFENPTGRHGYITNMYTRPAWRRMGIARLLVDQLAEEMADSLTVAKVDVDEAAGVAMKFGVNSIPTLLLFKGGQVVDTAIGALAKNELKALIDKNL